MKKLILFLSLTATVFAVQAQAEIQFKTDVIDYGKVAKGSDGIRVFEFTNTGDADLIINDVKSTCGCTVPEKPDGPIAAGKSGTIKVKYDTNRAVGPFRKAITVTSNAETPTKVLKIKGELVEGAK